MYSTREDGTVFFIAFGILVVALIIVQWIPSLIERFEGSDAVLDAFLLIQRTLLNIIESNASNNEINKNAKRLARRAQGYIDWWRSLSIEQKVLNKDVLSSPRIQRYVDEINTMIQTYSLEVSPIQVMNTTASSTSSR
jgi:hypothetical protein